MNKDDIKSILFQCEMKFQDMEKIANDEKQPLSDRLTNQNIATGILIAQCILANHCDLNLEKIKNEYNDLIRSAENKFK